MSSPSIEEVKDNLTEVCKTLDGKEWVLGNASLSNKGYANLGNVLTSYCHLRYLDASNNELGSLETEEEAVAETEGEEEEEAAPPAEEEGEATEAVAEKVKAAHSLQALTGLTSLLALNLSTNYILSFPKDLVLPNVQIINVKTNRMKSIPFNSESTPTLINLDVSENALTSVAGLDGISTLRMLSMNDNATITSLSGLGNLSGLEQLNCATCDIQDLNGLEGLTRSFLELDVSSNKIASLEPLNLCSDNLNGLKVINVSNNAIENLEELIHLASLKKLISIDLSGNPIADVDEFRTEVVMRVPNLQMINGVDVTLEERNNAKALSQQRKEEAAAAAAAAAEAAAAEEEEA